MSSRGKGDEDQQQKNAFDEEFFKESIERCIDKIRDMMMSESIGEFSDAEIELCSRIMDLKFSDDLELYTDNKEIYGEIDHNRPIKEETRYKLKSIVDRMNKTIISPNLARTLGLGDEKRELYGNLGEIKGLLMQSLNRNLKRVQEHRETTTRKTSSGRKPEADFEQIAGPEQDIAVVTLQAHWRGYLGRKVAKKMKTKRCYEQDELDGKYLFRQGNCAYASTFVHTTRLAADASTATEAFYAPIRERMKNYTQ